MPRLVAIAVLLMVLLASPVAAQTPAEAFAEAQQTYAVDDAAFQQAWAEYQAATSGPEHLTLLNDLERIAAKGQDDAHAIQSRACFAPWQRAHVGMWDLLVRLVANLRTEELLPQADIDRGSLYVDMLRSPYFAPLFDCEKG